jgi:BirA family biotin operon repressor/biotin-[acetyl-CoA-carboxylase] ligase
MAMVSDLSQALLLKALSPRPCQFYPKIDSTNERGLTLVAEGAPNGSIVVADEQTAGRGRLGRSWYAPAGTALMFSYVLHPNANALTYVGMMGALAVCEAVDSFGTRASIKWPNDVQINGRKLCGVLPEASWQATSLRGVALGIGVNVRVDFETTPFVGTAISLEDVAGKVDRIELLTRLLERLDYWTARLSSDALFQAWGGRLNMLGRRVRVTDTSGTLAGIAETVDRQGALLVRDDKGVLRRMIAGDIALG